MERMRPHVQSIVDGPPSAARTEGETDVVRDLAYTLPVAVISRIPGIPAEVHERNPYWNLDYDENFERAGDNLLVVFLLEEIGGSLQRAQAPGAEIQDASRSLNSDFFRETAG